MLEKNIETVLEALAEKIRHLETMNFCKDLEIKELKDQLAKIQIPKKEEQENEKKISI